MTRPATSTRRLRNVLLSPWLSLGVAAVFAVAWLAVDDVVLGPTAGWVQKTASALLSAMLGGIIALLFQLYGRLGTAIDGLQKIDQAVTSAERSQKAFSDLETRLLPNLYVNEEMKEFHKELISWGERLANDDSPTSQSERTAWSTLLDSYFRGERERVSNRTFQTTSDKFTNLVNQVTVTLGKSSGARSATSDNRQPVVRVHLTGMLPEEFFNGPQIEYTRRGSKPLFFCHRWEDYPALYEKQYRGAANTRVTRYIAVRRDKFQRAELSALPTFDDLRSQANLIILPTAFAGRSLRNDLDDEPDAVLRRLLRSAHISSDLGEAEVRELIRSVHGYESFRYWPIAEKAGIADQADWEPLLTYFSENYQLGPDSAALYWVLDEMPWAICEGDPRLRQCFESGWTPEVALFGTPTAEGNGQPVLWHFGILGLWRPFTRDMKLRFLTGSQASALHAGLLGAYDGSSAKGALRSLMAPTTAP